MLTGMILLSFFASFNGFNDDEFVPAIGSPWIRIAGNPDLGKYTTKRQQPVDFAVWQAADGSWQLWSCIRYTSCGERTRLFHRWESPKLTSPNWKPMGIAMEADPSFGELSGGLQAPHIVRENGMFHMFYGDWNHICHATSKDGKTFERVIQPSGKTAMFGEGIGNNARDICMLKVNDTWYGYYTAFPNDQGMVYCRTTKDFKSWSESSVVSFGGMNGTNRYACECPHVIERNGMYYLFRTQKYGSINRSTVYRSKQPDMFGINQDDRYLLNQLAVAAPEIVRHEGKDYIVALTPQLDGIRIAELKWTKSSQIDQPIFDFTDPSVRDEWKSMDANQPVRFTKSNRTRFDAPQDWFIGTGEDSNNELDDGYTCEIRSPDFVIQAPSYTLYLNGGVDAKKLYLAVVDAQTNKEIQRFTSTSQSNQFTPQLIVLEGYIGKTVYLKIVDQSKASWGHINFGGLYSIR